MRREHPDRFLIAKSGLLGAAWYGGFGNARNRVRQIFDGADKQITSFSGDKNSCYSNTYTGAVQVASIKLGTVADSRAFQC